MERLQRGRSITRGAAVMLAAVATHAAGAQVAAGRIVVRTGDTVLVRTFTPDMKARIDSMLILMRTLNDESPASPAFVKLRRTLDSLSMGLPLGEAGPLPAKRMGFQPQPRGWIGINVGLTPLYRTMTDSGMFERYFRYPPIVSVEPNSPAERAGIVPGDVLVAYNGEDVVSKFVNITQLLEPQKKVAITVRHDGETKEYAVTVTKAPERIHDRRIDAFGPDGPPEAGRVVGDIASRDLVFMASPTARVPAGILMFSPNGAFGVSLSNVGAELARTLKLKEGVLVNDAPETAPGFKAGLRPGDVIVSVSGKPVTTVGQVQRAIFAHVPERSVELEVVRDHKPKTLTVTW